MTLSLILKRIDTLKAEIDALRPLDAAQERRTMQKFRLDWTYHSNAIEGNTLTYGETRAFLLHGITAQGKPFRDYLDIKGHHEALDYLTDFVQQNITLTEAHIRELHRIIMVEPKRMPARTPDGQPTTRLIQIGQYKSMPNHVETSTGEIHYYATPQDTPIKMGELIRWYRQKLAEGLHPLSLAATFHYEFVSIHPFDDGNGRMARILMNLILMQGGYVPVVIQTASKEEYLLALEQADAGDLEPFIAHIGNGLIRSLDLFLRGARGESLDEPNDLDKKLALLQRKLESSTEVGSLMTQQVLMAWFDLFYEPFLTLLITQLSKFDALFAGNSLKVFCEPVTGNTIHLQRYKNETVATKIGSLGELRSLLSKDPSIQQVELRYELNGFNGRASKFRLAIYLDLHQNYFEISYSLTVDYGRGGRKDNRLYQEPYDVLVDETKQLASVNEITDALLALLHKMTSSD